MDDGKVYSDPDLTSSISDVLLSTNNDKTDANDSTPTSSTDAASSSGVVLNVSEDPISSTSSDVMEKDKLPGNKKGNAETDTLVPKNLLGTDGDVDLLDINIADVSSEPINEDVEDIVQDLENLLGEPEPQHDFPTRRKDKSPSKEKDLLTCDDHCEPNIIPETSDIQSSEKNETDSLIQPESNSGQIAEGSSNVVEESPKSDGDISPDKSETSPAKSEEKNECVEIEKTEDNSCKSEELNVATPVQSEETSETETIQKDALSEIAEVNEINTVTSSEVIVDNEDRPEELSHSVELNLVNTNEIEEVEVEEADEHLISPEKISEDNDSNIPIETKSQEVETDEPNASSSCGVEEIQIFDVLESKSNDEPDSLLTDQVSENLHYVETRQEVPEEQCPELESKVDEDNTSEEQQFSVEEELVTKEDEVNTSEEETVESTELAATTESENSEMKQSPSADPIQDCISSNLPDSKSIFSEALAITEEIATSVVEELEDDSNPVSTSPTEEVFEAPVDESSEVRDTPDDSSVLEVESEIEPNRNVTSSSDLSKNQDYDAESPIISDCTIIAHPEESSEVSLDEPMEILESREPVLEEIEDAVSSIPENLNVSQVEEAVITDKPLFEEIEEEDIKSEISTECQDIELGHPPKAEETLGIDDVTISEVQSLKDEQSPEEGTVEIDNPIKAEEYSTKEDITDTGAILEETSDSVEENIEQPLDNLATEDTTEQNSALDSPDAQSVPEIFEEKNESGEESVGNNIETLESVSEDVEKDKTLSPLVDYVVEEEIADDSSPAPEIVDNLSATNVNNADEVKEEDFESSCVENTDSVEANSKEDLLDTEVCVYEDKVEVTEENSAPHPDEGMITQDTEQPNIVPEDHTTAEEEPKTVTEEEESRKGDMGQVEEEVVEILPAEALDPEETIEEPTSVEIMGNTNEPSTEDTDFVESMPNISEITEHQDEVVSNIEKKVAEAVTENEITEEENVEEVSCSVTTPTEAANIEELEDDINTDSAKPDQENTFEAACSDSTTILLETNSEEEGAFELPKEPDTPESETIDLNDAIEESCSLTNEKTIDAEIKENTESVEEVVQDDKIVTLQETTEPELVPVIEELCVKKEIIYEHKCDSHKTTEKNITSNEEIEDNSGTQTIDTVLETPSRESSDLVFEKSEEIAEKVTDGEPETSAPSEEILPEQEQCMADSSVSSQKQGQTLPDEHNEELLIRPEVSATDIEKMEKDNKEAEEDVNKEHTFEQPDEHLVKESDVSEENVSSSQREEVTSSDQQDDQVHKMSSVSVDPNDSKVIAQSCPEIIERTVEESSHVRSIEEETEVEEIPEEIMEDQTSAAVQSILNNMSTEERSVEKIIEKEEPPVVHSSYSSYEVQKAVQEIQGITNTVEAVVISSEEIECISSSEKPSDSEKIEFENENCAETNIGSQDEVVEMQMSQNKESDLSSVSKLEETSTVIIPESSAVDKIECVEEIVDSPLSEAENQEAITQSSYEANQEIDEDVRSSENQSSVERCSSGKSYINEPVVVPSIDLSEESSSEEDSDEDKKQEVVSSSVTSTSGNKESHSDAEDKDIKTVVSKHASKAEKVSGNTVLKNESKKYSPRETRHSSRISEKMKPHNSKEDVNQPLSVNIEENEREKPYSPKITIKPIKEDEPSEDKEEHKGSLKITITKQSDNTHSILKMCSPDVDHRQRQSENEDQNVIPKLVIKTSDTHSEQHSPKMSTRSSKTVLPANSNIRSGSPRITIKPIIKPDSRETITSPLKITIKPIGKPEEFSRQQQRHSPKQNKNKTDEDHYSTRSKVTKSSESSDVHSPKFTIKPVKPPEDAEIVTTPKITIKPIEKPEEARTSPKITIKPVVRPVELETEVEDEVKQRIVLKINKGNLPPKDTERIGRESRKRELEDDKSEKLAKIKLKFSKDGDAHIVHKSRQKDADTQASNKRQQELETDRSKRFKPDANATDSDDDVKVIENAQSPIVISEDSQSQDSVILVEDAKDPLADVAIPEPKPQVIPVTGPRKRGRPRKVPLVAREEYGSEQKEKTIQATIVSVSSTNQSIETETTGRPKRSCRAQSVRDTLGIKPRKPSKPRGGKRGAGAKSISMKPEKEQGYSERKINVIKKSLLTEEALQDACNSGILKVSVQGSLPKKLESKKEEPIKPLGLKSLLEAAKDQNIIEVIEIDTPSNSPKSLEAVEQEKTEEEESAVEEKEKIGDADKDIGVSETIDEIKNFEIQKGVLDLRDEGDGIKEPSVFCGTDAAVSDDVEMQAPTPVFAPPLSEASAVDISSTTDIAMFEEETRMSADVSSRAQTPAKQVVSADVVVEESQSSMQSTATTESGKISRRSRLEVHQDQDGSVFTADQLNEYYWAGNGPFMIQEQVAQYLGIKSFKRKYPGIPRRMVDMQERDHIRENGLASESMCDLGLTAVNSADILDIMYTDFQEKYEEFCRFQREKQAKDLLNKQKALAMATNQEKSKLDILEQAVQSAAAYNANFNKTRREQRRACMDLQTMNIHYPKGKLKKINMPKIGSYPVAVVPGQFTDYYKEFTPTELNNLPLNTMLYTELHKILPDISDSDSESSGSDSDDSSSSGSESNSSCEDNCKMCDKGSVTPRKSPVNSII